MRLEYRAQKQDDGKTVKQIIESRYNLSSRTLSKLKATGGITVDGSVVTVRHLLKEGQVLILTLSDAQGSTVEQSNIPLDVLYEDDYILVVNKPYGMPTHPSQGHHLDTLANAVMYRYREKPFTFRAITRLAGDTTGVVLVARDALSAQRLTDMLQRGELEKQYLAVVEGVPENREGTIDKAIARCRDSVIKRCIDAENGKPSITKYSLIKTTSDGKYSLISAIPVTGRTHQIRLHLSYTGIPIYGDFLYGTPIDNVRAYLHCHRLCFNHPVTGQRLEITADLPCDMAKIMEN